MPFLLPLLPALAAGGASAAGGALVNGLINSGGQKGSGFQAQAANIQNPQDNAQAQAAQGQVQSGLGQQQNLVNALQGQNGIGNQSQVYNQLQGIANGTGPNPAQAMLNQATGQNVANQAALMASQRGAGANVGLMARQAGMQGGALQQQAAGQGATMQAQQSLGALGQAGNIAGQQVGNQMGATQAYNQLAQGNQQELLNSIAQNNQAQIANTSQQNQANAGIAGVNAKNQASAAGGIASGLGAAVGQALKPSATPAPADTVSASGDVASRPMFSEGGAVENPKLAAVSKMHRFPAHLGHVAALYHGDKYHDAHQHHKIASSENKFKDGGDVGSALKQGGKVPGQALVKGDSPRNDIVKAKLSPGEVVIPKSVMESDDPVKGAAEFVAAIHKKKGKGNHESDFRDALNRAIAGRKKS